MILRQNRKGVATEEIARDVKVSQRRVQQIINEYKETGQEPVFGEKVGHPRKPFIKMEAEVIRTSLPLVASREIRLGCLPITLALRPQR